MNPFGNERRATPNPKTQPSDVFPAAFARKPLGAPPLRLRPERGQLEGGCRAAGSRRSSRPRLARRCQPCVRGARHGGSRRPSRLLPLGASGTAEVETWLRPWARWPKELPPAQGRECAGRRPRPITPSPGGKGERRCVAFQGSACILGRRLCLPALGASDA